MNRLIKQLVYGFFYLMVFGGVVVFAYYFLIRPAPSCFDGKQNQDEAGVDCGGVCAKVCIPIDNRPIETVIPAQGFAPAPGIFAVIARIQNPNLTVGAATFSYEFTIYDTQDHQFHLSGKSYAYAGEAKYITALVTDGSIPVSPVRISHIDTTISNVVWVSAGQFVKPVLRLQDFTTTVEADRIRVDGKIINDDPLVLSRVPVIAFFYGRFNQLVGFAQTTVDAVGPNETRPFTLIHPLLPDFISSSTQVVVTPAFVR